MCLTSHKTWNRHAGITYGSNSSESCSDYSGWGYNPNSGTIIISKINVFNLKYNYDNQNTKTKTSDENSDEIIDFFHLLLNTVVMYSFDCCNHISNSENIIIRLQKCLNSKHIGQKSKYKFCIGGRIYQQHVFIEEIDIAIRIVQAEWYQLQDMVFYNRTIPLSDVNFSREVINMTFHEIFESLQSCKCPSQKERYLKTIMNSVNKFSASVVQLSKLEDDILLKLLSPSVINLKKSYISVYSRDYGYLVLHINIGVSLWAARKKSGGKDNKNNGGPGNHFQK
ncbi:hypothetical protein NQ317_014164 [Molorchus minor]|uniref:Uncharacterized protein n=1 Tax=Molorchus minor TaxID=1323400 RepID=A0ABQ9IYS3_9CUCU|nr:hypothetical protein NQ317_014164 [Molorchus minor]